MHYRHKSPNGKVSNSNSAVNKVHTAQQTCQQRGALLCLISCGRSAKRGRFRSLSSRSIKQSDNSEFYVNTSIVSIKQS